MKKTVFFIIVSLFFIQKSFSQAERVHGPIEKIMTDSLCSCVVKVDLSKITNKTDATAAYTDCVMKNINVLKDLADERKVNMGDKEAMEKVGIDLAMDLLNLDCKGFKQLALVMGGSNKNGDVEVSATTTGNFKRIENKGFNYFIITDGNNKEKSFIWLRQFTGSEKFITESAKYIGKKMNIKYQEIEVYLPQAKGYYKIKEITGIEIL